MLVGTQQKSVFLFSLADILNADESKDTEPKSRVRLESSVTSIQTVTQNSSTFAFIAGANGTVTLVRVNTGHEDLIATVVSEWSMLLVSRINQLLITSAGLVTTTYKQKPKQLSLEQRSF